uniref:Wsv285-like protein n=1 Tax=Metapenaeus joyneri majanivirus TaxID=2984280 RepID=A0A9C7BI96_9VIRU|nr:MAG: wsv285-like protein [Metapenaeus joyneri majanivirus]
METINDKVIQLLCNITNERKSTNTHNIKIDKTSISNAIRKSGPSPSDEQAWTNIMSRLEDEQRYLENVRQSIVELSKCKGDKKFFNYNGEEGQNLQDEHLEALYNEGIYWEGIVTNKNILIVTINIILDIIQHMGGNELWLFNRLHRDICKTKMTVMATSENVMDTSTMSNSLWLCSKYNYETSGTDDIKSALSHLINSIGCIIKNKTENTNISNIYYNFRFTDTALGCPIELSTGSGCFNKAGQNVPLEKKDTTKISYENSINAPIMDNSSFVNRLIGKNNSNNKNPNQFETDESTEMETSYMMRGKFPTLGPRGNFDEHKYIARKYIDFLDNVLTSLATPITKLHESDDIFQIRNEKYDTNLAIFLAIIHPKVKYRFLLSLFLTIVLIRTRGNKSDSHFDKNKKRIIHGRDTKVSTMDNTGPRYRLVNETCACREICPNANRYYPHPVHNHHPLDIQKGMPDLKDDDPLLFSHNNKNVSDKCYPNRVIHQHYCGVIFPCKRSDTSALGIKNGALSLRNKDSQSNTQNFTIDTIKSLPEYHHRVVCRVSFIKDFLNSIVLKPWDSICENAKKKGMSYRDLLLNFIKIPLLLGNLEKELNTKLLNTKIDSGPTQTERFMYINTLYSIYPNMQEVFQLLSVFFDYDMENVFSNRVEMINSNQLTTEDFTMQVAESYKGVKFLINKKAATFLTTINNHFYIMSHTALIGFRHKCEFSQNKMISEGLKFHQISLQNYSLICSPDYIYKSKCQQLLIDNAAVESVKEKNESILNLVSKEKINNIIQNTNLNYMFSKRYGENDVNNNDDVNNNNNDNNVNNNNNNNSDNSDNSDDDDENHDNEEEEKENDDNNNNDVDVNSSSMKRKNIIDTGRDIMNNESKRKKIYNKRELSNTIVEEEIEEEIEETEDREKVIEEGEVEDSEEEEEEEK